MRLRPATPHDAAALAGLHRWVHDLHVAAEPGIYRAVDATQVELALRERLAQPDVRAVIAEVDGVPAGGLMAQAVRRAATFTSPPREFLLILELAVAPQARRRGIGRALMEAALGLARELDLPRLELDVRAWNEAAQAFFRALGYAPMHLRLGRPTGR